MKYAFIHRYTVHIDTQMHGDGETEKAELCPVVPGCRQIHWKLSQLKFVHLYNDDCFREDILRLIPLEGHSTSYYFPEDC